MEAEGISKAPTLIHMAIANVTYSHIIMTTTMVAEMIRGLGYHVIPSINDMALTKHSSCYNSESRSTRA